MAIIHTKTCGQGSLMNEGAVFFLNTGFSCSQQLLVKPRHILALKI